NQNQIYPTDEETPMSSHPCCRTLLARGPSAEVARCSCGHIHLSLGPMTIRLDEETLHAMWHTVGDALRAISNMTAEERAEAAATSSEWKQ
ncbi:MAG: hypothetical protein ABW123_29400, partial [Cystobacter sp.]